MAVRERQRHDDEGDEGAEGQVGEERHAVALDGEAEDEPRGAVAVRPSAECYRRMEDVLDPVNDDGAFFIGHVQHAFDAQPECAQFRDLFATRSVPDTSGLVL